MEAGFNTSDLTDEIAAVILSLPLSFVRLLGTIIAISVIDAKGRRYVLMFTLPILAVSMIVIGAAFAAYIESQYELIQSVGKWVALTCMVVFLFTYSTGMASIPWLINSEIYPLFLIGSASALSAFTNWITSFAMTTIFDRTNFIVSLEAAGVCNIFTYLFVLCFIKETGGNSITKNIALMLNKSQREVTQFVQRTQNISSGGQEAASVEAKTGEITNNNKEAGLIAQAQDDSNLMLMRQEDSETAIREQIQ